MIRYSLKCVRGHGFESWFQSAAAYDSLNHARRIECPDCGDTGIEKALMAPGVASARPPADTPAPPALAPKTDRERALAELRARVEANSDYVGMNFVAEARAMHDGDVPSRSIHGEARLDEAKKLLEDGVPVAPLPFRPRSRTN